MYLLIQHLKPKLSSNAMHIIMVSTRMNVQLNIQLSQSSAATNLRGGGKFYSSFTCSLYQNTTVKELLKSVHICESYPKNITCTFFMAHGVLLLLLLHSCCCCSSRSSCCCFCVDQNYDKFASMSKFSQRNWNMNWMPAFRYEMEKIPL